MSSGVPSLNSASVQPHTRAKQQHTVVRIQFVFPAVPCPQRKPAAPPLPAEGVVQSNTMNGPKSCRNSSTAFGRMCSRNNSVDWCVFSFDRWPITHNGCVTSPSATKKQMYHYFPAHTRPSTKKGRFSLVYCVCRALVRQALWSNASDPPTAQTMHRNRWARAPAQKSPG